MWCSSGVKNACLLLVLVNVANLAEGKAAKLFGLEQSSFPHDELSDSVANEQLRQNFGNFGQQGSFGQQAGGTTQTGDNAPAQYEFAYDVKVPEEGNDYGHAERRNGDTTEGMYRVLLPDGRVQVVTYSVIGDSGFVATVTYQ